MNDTEFHQRADTMLDQLFSLLEAADARGDLEIEYADGVITIEMPDRRTYIVNKHTASQQIWMSSPVSGGLHFRYGEGVWTIPDGRTLKEVLLDELKVSVA